MKSDWKPVLPPFRTHKKEVYKNMSLVSDFIYQIGEYSSLREKSKEIPVTKITSPEYQAKIAYMKRCLLKYRKITGKGRGIAAVQLGFPEKMIVVFMPEIKGKLLIIINPKITKSAKQLFIYPEMCMSANPAIAPVVRPAWIEFTYYDEFGKKQSWNTKAEDTLGIMYNRVFEHEIDHLDGVINIDRVQSREIIYESDPKFYQTASFQEVKAGKNSKDGKKAQKPKTNAKPSARHK